jgi:hypothetical protein
LPFWISGATLALSLRVGSPDLRKIFLSMPHHNRATNIGMFAAPTPSLFCSGAGMG